jgi:hypothetical protein
MMADGGVGDAEFLGGKTDPTRVGEARKGAQGIERWQAGRLHCSKN